MIPRSALVAALAALAALVVAGCTDDDGDAGGNAVALDDVELTRFEDDRLAFDHPADWEIVDQGEGGEQHIHIERAADDDGHPLGLVYAVWPIIPGDDLERTIGFFEPDPDTDEVTDLDQQDVEVAGASAAVLQTFVATDAVPDDDRPVRFWGLYAMAEAGRTVHLIIGIPDHAPYDGPAVAEAILDSLELTWEDR